MSVLINGIEMPKEGTYNIVHIYSDGHVAMPFWGKGMQIVQGVNAVEVVRCKDCVHWDKSNLLPPRCVVFDWFSKKSDYCSFAERRNE